MYFNRESYWCGEIQNPNALFLNGEMLTYDENLAASNLPVQLPIKQIQTVRVTVVEVFQPTSLYSLVNTGHETSPRRPPLPRKVAFKIPA